MRQIDQSTKLGKIFEVALAKQQSSVHFYQNLYRKVERMIKYL